MTIATHYGDDDHLTCATCYQYEDDLCSSGESDHYGHSVAEFHPACISHLTVTDLREKRKRKKLPPAKPKEPKRQGPWSSDTVRAIDAAIDKEVPCPAFLKGPRLMNMPGPCPKDGFFPHQCPECKTRGR